MSHEQPPDPQILKDTVSKLDQFVAYLVNVLKGKNWTVKLLLLDVLLFAVFNPVSFSKILQLFGLKDLPAHYPLYFWLVICGIFVAALSVAWRSQLKDKLGRDLGARSAVKGLLPYSKEDAALFARLQREQDLSDCLQAIMAMDFRFGVLCGDSGNGKTSFLQAGLWPALQQNNYRCVYVKCTELDPVEAIGQALVEQLGDADGVKSVQSLPEILKPFGKGPTPLVLIVDQFEQFFVHRPRRRDRTQFLASMEEWYKAHELFLVKVLVCLRSDFLDRLIELQKVLGYSLGPHQSFRLDKFTPSQAAEIFRVIAEHEKLSYDPGFVEKMAVEELAGATDGLVSPVDIQVLAWMVMGQKGKTERAFDEKTFRKLGGVEGLLERFLIRALDARETDQRRQATIKVLLGLTDLERNTRAGVLTLTELQDKLRGYLQPAEISECIEWLSRGDVRLIAPVKRSSSVEKESHGYELAHERLIPPLRRIAGKQLGDVGRAEQLLDRRTNEWLGSGRAGRYLFSWSELRLINQQRLLISWGTNRAAKEELLAWSQRRFHLRYAAAGVAMLLVLVGWVSWKSNQWQTFLIKRELRNYGDSLNDNQALYNVAQAFVYAGDSQQVDHVVGRLSQTFSKPKALVAIGKAYVKFRDKERQGVLLAEALKTDEKVRLKPLDTSLLRAIAKSYSKLGVTLSDRTLLAKAVETTALVTHDADRSEVLDPVIDSFIKVAECTSDHTLLSDAVKALELIYPGYDHSITLTTIADSYAKFGHKEQARALLAQATNEVDSLRSPSLNEPVVDSYLLLHAIAAIAESYSELGDNEAARAVLGQEVKNTILIKDNRSKNDALSDIVTHYAKIGQKGNDRVALAEGIKTALLISEKSYQNRGLFEIITSYFKLAETTNDVSLIAQAIEQVERFRPGYRTFYIDDVAESYAKLGETSRDLSLLSEAVRIALLITDDSQRTGTLSAITKSYLAAGEATKNRALLSEAATTARLVNHESIKGGLLQEIAESYIKLEEKQAANALLTEAQKNANLNTTNSQEIPLWRLIAESYLKLDYKEQASAVLAQVANTVGPGNARSQDIPLLQTLSELYDKLGDKEQAREQLRTAIKTTETLSDKASEAFALVTIAESFGKLGDTTEATSLLAEAVTASALIERDFDKADLRGTIAEAYVKLAESANDRNLYRESFRLIEGLQGDQGRDVVLAAIVSSKFAVTDIASLRSLASHFGSEAGRATALARILIVISHPELIRQEESDDDDEDEDEDELGVENAITASRVPAMETNL